MEVNRFVKSSENDGWAGLNKSSERGEGHITRSNGVGNKRDMTKGKAKAEDAGQGSVQI